MDFISWNLYLYKKLWHSNDNKNVSVVKIRVFWCKFYCIVHCRRENGRLWDIFHILRLFKFTLALRKGGKVDVSAILFPSNVTLMNFVYFVWSFRLLLSYIDEWMDVLLTFEEMLKCVKYIFRTRFKIYFSLYYIFISY